MGHILNEGIAYYQELFGNHKGQFENVKMVVFVELNQDLKPLECVKQKIEALSLSEVYWKSGYCNSFGQFLSFNGKVPLPLFFY